MSYMLEILLQINTCFGMIATLCFISKVGPQEIHRSQPLSYLAFVIQRFGHRRQLSQTFGRQLVSNRLEPLLTRTLRDSLLQRSPPELLQVLQVLHKRFLEHPTHRRLL